ncbi:MAG TPA: hypothetical protein VFF06_36270 [Polyangia bacterium]|nr:hypothetical protein [Polyangia bacterium]
MVKCGRCGKQIKSSEEIARWLRVLLREVEELAVVRMIDGDLAAGRISAQDADGQRASVMLPYVRIHLTQLIEGIELCPHSGPAGSESGSGGRPAV